MGRQERRKLPIPFGQGLDRASGVSVKQPTLFEDLRNVFLFAGKAQIRKGTEFTATLQDNTPADLDMVLQLAPLRTEGAAMGVGFDTTSKEAFLNRLSILGTNATPVPSADTNGRLFLLDGAATFDPPVVHMVDTFGRMYIAHDEPLLASRNATRVYNPNAAPQIDDLTGDLDDDGISEPIKFRGITRHLSYLVGWGYGTDADQDRPDIVRVSLAGDPDIFDPRHFFKAGQRSEPVLTCRTAGNLLLVFKETETYEIFGYSPETFGIRPADTLFGCVGSRLAVTIANTVFFWSTQGPRMSSGGESIDLAIPLDIGGPDPATLVAESDPEEAFAVYSALDRVVMWVWGRRVYALSIRMPQEIRWSYYELGANAEPFSGAEFFSTLATGGGGAAPVGWPRVGGADGGALGPPPALPVSGDTSITFELHNNGGGGLGSNEVLEVHVKDVDGTGGWSKRPDISLGPARAAGGPDFAQTVVVDGLDPTQEYEVSMRYRGGGQFTPGFGAPGDGTGDPDTWNDPACPACAEDPPAYIPGLFTTVSPPILTSRFASDGNNGLWERVDVSTEQITIPIEIPAGHENLVMQVERARNTVGDVAVQDINGAGMGPPASADQSVEAFIVIEAALAAGSTSYVDQALTANQIHIYRVKFLSPGGGPDSVTSNNLPCHAGPDPPTNLQAACAGGGIVNLNWIVTGSPPGRTNCPSGTPPSKHRTEMWWNNDTADPLQDNWFQDGSLGVGLQSGQVFAVGTSPGDDISTSVRHEVKCTFGATVIQHWSKWVDGGVPQTCTDT